MQCLIRASGWRYKKHRGPISAVKLVSCCFSPSDKRRSLMGSRFIFSPFPENLICTCTLKNTINEIKSIKMSKKKKMTAYFGKLTVLCCVNYIRNTTRQYTLYKGHVWSKTSLQMTKKGTFIVGVSPRSCSSSKQRWRNWLHFQSLPGSVPVLPWGVEQRNRKWWGFV